MKKGMSYKGGLGNAGIAGEKGMKGKSGQKMSPKKTTRSGKRPTPKGEKIGPQA
jgi:hypothetical protein